MTTGKRERRRAKQQSDWSRSTGLILMVCVQIGLFPDGWQPFEVTFLCRRLQKCSTLRYLNLDSNDLGPIHLEALAMGLDSAEHIRVVSLRDNKLQGTFVDDTGIDRGCYDGRGVKRLAKHLAQRRGMRSLDLRGSHIDDRAGKDGLAQAIYEGSHALECLDWIDLREGDGVEDESIVRPASPGVILDAKGLDMCTSAFLARGLRAQPELVAVEAPGNGVCVEWSCNCLAEALRTPKCQLITLVLNKTILRVEGAVPLFEALKKCCPPLEVLELSHACLCDSWVGYNRERSLDAMRECASALTALKCNLKQLILDFNNLQDDGLQIIATALERNSSLGTLGLRSNALSEGTDLARMLRANRGLTSLDLSRNKFTQKGPEALVEVADALVKNRSLKTLDLTGSGVDSASGPRSALLEPAAVALARPASTRTPLHRCGSRTSMASRPALCLLGRRRTRRATGAPMQTALFAQRERGTPGALARPSRRGTCMWHRAEGAVHFLAPRRCGDIGGAFVPFVHATCRRRDMRRCSACGVEHGVQETRPPKTGGVERELRVGYDGEAVARQPGRVGVEDPHLVGPSIIVERHAEDVRAVNVLRPLLDLGPVDVVSGKLHAHAAALGVGPRVGGGLDSVDRLDVAEGDAPPVRRRRLGRQAGRADRHQCLGLGGVVVVAAATGPASGAAAAPRLAWASSWRSWRVLRAAMEPYCCGRASSRARDGEDGEQLQVARESLKSSPVRPAVPRCCSLKN